MQRLLLMATINEIVLEVTIKLGRVVRFMNDSQVDGDLRFRISLEAE